VSYFIGDIREFYETELIRDGLTSEVLENLPKHLRIMAFYKPCQFHIFEFSSISRVLWLITHVKNKPDMAIKVFKGIEEKPKAFVSAHKQYKKYSWTFDITEDVKEFKFHPELLTAKDHLGFLFSSEPRNIIYKAKELGNAKMSSLIVESTKTLEDSLDKLRKIDEHEQKLMTLEDEIIGVRKLVGTTKEFQEFRAFTTELENLKKTHIHREVFLTEVKRLDEKMEKGLEALNTRIEDLKAIKLWSKRTLLEIALAILAIISTLFATGTLKF